MPGMPGMGNGGMMNPMMAMMGGGMPGMGDTMSSSGGIGSAGTFGMDASTASSGGQGAEMVIRAVKDLPPDVAADPRGFMLRCALPGHMVGALIGQGGSGTKEVQDFTGTKISIPGTADEATRIMSIEGPLLNVCAAYMLMMVRYINSEQEPNGGSSTGSGGQMMFPFAGMC